MTQEELAEACVPVAAQLIATVRDYGPDDVRAVLATVPQGRYDALCVVLAAMVDPDSNAAQLLEWTTAGPVQSRDMTPAHLYVKNIPVGAWGRQKERREEVARLTNAGLSADEIGERLGITSRAVTRHRSAIRAAISEQSEVAS